MNSKNDLFYQDFKATKVLALELPINTVRKVSGSNPFTAVNANNGSFVAWTSQDINYSFDCEIENPLTGQLMKAKTVDFFTILSK
jgi:hypothetical protein